jgi:hypothetical protein
VLVTKLVLYVVVLLVSVEYAVLVAMVVNPNPVPEAVEYVVSVDLVVSVE